MAEFRLSDFVWDNDLKILIKGVKYDAHNAYANTGFFIVGKTKTVKFRRCINDYDAPLDRTQKFLDKHGLRSHAISHAIWTFKSLDSYFVADGLEVYAAFYKED